MVRGETRNQATELRRGVLELCVLAVLQRGESYAFDIVRDLSDAGELLTSEGTIYPLLARMREMEIGFTDLDTQESSLEDIFVDLVRGKR